MDELAQFNKSRWEALAQARVLYSRPQLDLRESSAREWLAKERSFVRSGIGDVAGKDVLLLAGGGGQQSAVFGMLGARVTVLDLSETQLGRDRESAAHYGYQVTTVQGDMRDLSRFARDSFDVVWHPFSISFVPDARQVIGQVARVIRPGGLYNLDFANPFWSMEEGDWTEKGYPIQQPYVQGAQFRFVDPYWTFEDEAGNPQRVEGPHEFLHTFATIFNGLVEEGFIIVSFAEGPPGEANAKPGTWEHLVTIVPPFMTVGAIYRPNVMLEEMTTDFRI